MQNNYLLIDHKNKVGADGELKKAVERMKIHRMKKCRLTEVVPIFVMPVGLAASAAPIALRCFRYQTGGMVCVSWSYLLQFLKVFA